MLKILKQKQVPFLVYLLFLIGGVLLISFYDKVEIQLFINQFYHPVGNTIFTFFTHLGEGWLSVPLLVGLFIYNWKKGLYVGLSYGVSALFVYLLKFHVFDIINRPFGTLALNSLETYQWLPDVKMPVQMSFPSGHTTSGFAIFISLLLIFKNQKLGIFFVIVACFIGLSRTYLSYHFFTDVIAGSFLGTFTAIIMHYFLKKPLKLAD